LPDRATTRRCHKAESSETIKTLSLRPLLRGRRDIEGSVPASASNSIKPEALRFVSGVGEGVEYKILYRARGSRAGNGWVKEWARDGFIYISEMYKKTVGKGGEAG
jgi:hypothetical protein